MPMPEERREPPEKKARKGKKIVGNVRPPEAPVKERRHVPTYEHG
jgi:hypothetical protein